jgi:hypothetical protein
MKAILAAALLALLASGCVEVPHLPPLPVRLVIADDVPEEDAEAWEAAVIEWNAALPRDAVASVSRGRLEGCGILVTSDRGMADKDSGFATIGGECRGLVMIRSGQGEWQRRVSAVHELGHVLQSEWGHSADVASVMHRRLVGAEQAILPPDVAPVLERFERGW